MSAAESAHGNAATYFVDSHIAAGRAAKPAFREVDGAKRSLTYGELSEESSRVAGSFAAAGIRRESRAAMLCLDTIEYPQLFWGALKAGVVAVPKQKAMSPGCHAGCCHKSTPTAACSPAQQRHQLSTRPRKAADIRWCRDTAWPHVTRARCRRPRKPRLCATTLQKVHRRSGFSLHHRLLGRLIYRLGPPRYASRQNSWPHCPARILLCSFFPPPFMSARPSRRSVAGLIFR